MLLAGENVVGQLARLALVSKREQAIGEPGGDVGVLRILRMPANFSSFKLIERTVRAS